MNTLINLQTNDSTAKHSGFVWLAGSGPGNADLLTIKAFKAILTADVVLYDSLVDSSIIDLIPPHTVKEYVGKRCGQHSMPQGDICQRIVFHALNGKKVLRLKGGDPAIFARTFEETQALTKHNIAFNIIPGVTSASGASAYSGIPLTQRDCAQSLTLTTASLKCPEKEPNWRALVDKSQQQTLVFYMGLGRLQTIAKRLLEHGLDEDFPVAVVDRACSTNQTIIKSTLLNIALDVKESNIEGPAIIICGQVVNHQQQVHYLSDMSDPCDDIDTFELSHFIQGVRREYDQTGVKKAV